MKKFEIREILYGGKWFYDKTSKSYKQKTIYHGTYNTFEKAIIEWRKLHKANKLLDYKIQVVY